jgi:hypothetical protein
MRALSEMCAGASALAIMAACITWGAEIGVPSVSVGYLGAGALCAALSLAIDWRRA